MQNANNITQLDGASLLIKNIHVYGYDKTTAQLNTVLINRTGELHILDTMTTPVADYLFDAKEKYTLMPGMMDAHVHGQGGYDFADVGKHPESIPLIMKALGETGLSYAMVTLVSLEMPDLIKSLNSLNQYVTAAELDSVPGVAKIVGVHLEGPFISKKCKGAHSEKALQSHIDLDQFKRIISAAPDIKQWKMTLAADLPGAEQFIHDVKQLEAKDIHTQIFIGHCNPDDKTAIDRAIQAGAVGFTHLGNACQETCCREDRDLHEADSTSHLVQWVFKNPDQCPAGIELIVDGVHLSRSFVKLLKEKTGNKIALVTDALGPAGLSDGQYKLGTLPIIKDKNSFYLANEAGDYLLKETQGPNGSTEYVRVLAGSAASMADCAAQYAEWTSDQGKSIQAQMDSIYTALIQNPRTSALSPSAIVQLQDHKNCIILNEKGQLMLSLCNGKPNIHDHNFPITSCKQPQSIAFQPQFFQGKQLDYPTSAVELAARDNKVQSRKT